MHTPWYSLFIKWMKNTSSLFACCCANKKKSSSFGFLQICDIHLVPSHSEHLTRCGCVTTITSTRPLFLQVLLTPGLDETGQWLDSTILFCYCLNSKCKEREKTKSHAVPRDNFFLKDGSWAKSPVNEVQAGRIFFLLSSYSCYTKEDENGEECPQTIVRQGFSWQKTNIFRWHLAWLLCILIICKAWQSKTIRYPFL